MNPTKSEYELFEALCEIPVIDSHEHLVPEQEYLSYAYSGLNMFAGYLFYDLGSAGLDPEFQATLRDPGYRSVDHWWPVIRKYWEHVEHSSYARALKIAVKELYGIDQINTDTIFELAELIIADNTPGLYDRILRERCGIRRVVTQIKTVSFPNDPILAGLTHYPVALHPGFHGLDYIGRISEAAGGGLETLDDYAEALRKLMQQSVQEGSRGLKMVAGDYQIPDKAKAERELRQYLASSDFTMESMALRSYLLEVCLDVVSEHDLAAVVHGGYWRDFRENDPKHLLGFARRRTDVRFDLLHLGMPMIRDALLIGKNLPNVSLNLAWCPIISFEQTVHAINEMIDLVPMNKIIAFGGDYYMCVQKIYGHLTMARQAIAQVLSRRVSRGDFTKDQALSIARMWLYDNPGRIYRVN